MTFPLESILSLGVYPSEVIYSKTTIEYFKIFGFFFSNPERQKVFPLFEFSLMLDQNLPIFFCEKIFRLLYFILRALGNNFCPSSLNNAFELILLLKVIEDVAAGLLLSVTLFPCEFPA